jgi:hypothetical protein
MIEIWKDIKGYENYEGYYQISNQGRVRGLDRYVKHSNIVIFIKERVLKQALSTRGYFFLGLNKNGVGIRHRVHRLVAEAFIPNPFNLPEVNHKNGIKTDNRVENLEWVTHKENIQHAFRTGLANNDNHNKKVLMLSLINEPLLWFDSIKEAGETNFIDTGSISKCCRGIRKIAGGYKWKFYKK